MLEILIIQAIIIVVGAFLHHRTMNKHDGTIAIKETETKKTILFEMDIDPDVLEQRRRVVFRVRIDSE